MGVHIKIWLFTLTVLVAFGSAHANTITWKNGSSGNWSDSANWNPKHVPGANDTAVITANGTYTVTLDAAANVSGLVLGANDGNTQTFLVNGQTFTTGGQVTVNAGGVFNLSSGTFAGDTGSGGAVFSGTLAPSGGALAGKLTMTSNSVLNLAAISTTNVLAGLTLFTNYGTVTWSNTDLYGASGLQIFNSGLWDAQTANTFFGSGTVFKNSGTFRKSAGGGGTTTLDSGITFNSTGTVDLHGGTLAIQAGTCSGIFNTASGNVFNFGTNFNSFTLTDSATFTGSGTVKGYLNGNNALIDGAVTFSAANLYGSMTVSNTGVVNFTGTLGLDTFGGVTLNNYGTVNWNNTDLSISAGFVAAHINNYGLWIAQGDNTFSGIFNDYTSTVFNNYGTFRKSGGSGQTRLSFMTFNSPGSVDVQTGLLFFDRGSGSGVFNTATNATTYLSAFTLTGNPTFTGAGFLEGYALIGNNAVVHGVENFKLGQFAGTLTLANDNTLNLLAYPFGDPNTFLNLNLTNNGTVNWNYNGANLAGSGAQIYNYGLWDAQTNATMSGVTFNNYGTFRKSGGTGGGYPNYATYFDNSTTFNNSGTVDVQIGSLNISGGTGSGTFSTATNAQSGIYFVNYTLTGSPVFAGSGVVQGNLNGNDAVINGTINLPGSVTLSGTLTFASNCVANMSSPPGFTYSIIFNGVLLTNYGTVVWNGTDLNGQSSPQIYNYGLWDAKTNNTFYGAYNSSGTTTFNNYGTFRKSGGDVYGNPSSTILDNSTTFNNLGTVDVQIGALSISGGCGGGVFNNASATNTGTFFNSYTLTGNPTFTGPGVVWGFLTGNNAVIGGAMNFNYGSLSGTLTVASNATMNLFHITQEFSPPPITFNAVVLTNCGTVIWSGVDLDGSSSPQIYNYGLWDAQTNNTFYGAYNSGGTTTFNNYGTFRKSGGNNTAPNYITLLDNNTTFNNFGTVDGQIGFLDFSGGSGSGVFNTATNAVVSVSTYTLTGNPTFTGGGGVGGNFIGNNAIIHGSMSFGYGALSGTLTVASNATVSFNQFFGSPSFSGTIFTNYGAVVWGNTDLYGVSSPQIYNYGLWDVQTNKTFYGAYNSSGTTTFNNYGTFRKSGGGSFGSTYLDNSTTFNNPGTVDDQSGLLSLAGSYALTGGTFKFGINSPSDFGSIYLSGNAALTGTLIVNLNNGYSPVAGSSFALLNYGSETGIFTAMNLPHLAGLIWQTNYGATAFTLSVTNLPAPALAPVAMPGGGMIAFSWNALDGQTYQLQYTTNLAPANWVNLGNVITGTNGPMAVSDAIGQDPHRFYRLVVLP